MTTTLDPPVVGLKPYQQLSIYRDVFNHLNRAQRAELRKEYRHLRNMGVMRGLAKGVILRTASVVQGWD